MMSIGIPRPSSATETELSGWITTQIFLANPARASSIQLSIISVKQWCNPLVSVEPIYMAGLFLTGSKPSKTTICSPV